MKVFKYVGNILVAFTLIALLTHCDDDNKSSDDLTKIAKTWTLVSAKLDNETAEQILDSFTLKINADKTYEVSGTEFPSPWPPKGAFTVKSTSEEGGVLLREDGTTIAYILSSNGQLSLSFSFTDEGYAGGRVSTISGNWNFVLK